MTLNSLALPLSMERLPVRFGTLPEGVRILPMSLESLSLSIEDSLRKFGLTAKLIKNNLLILWRAVIDDR